MKKCILIGAGEFYEKEIPIEKEDLVIACDGGYAYCQQLKITPHLVVSDFDSYKNEIKDVKVNRSQPEKDDTDMLLGIQEGLNQGYHEFVIYGAMGGRIEHTLANIQCLKYLLDHDAHGVMISKNVSIDVMGEGCIEYSEYEKGYISVFSLNDNSLVSIENLKYPLDHAILSNAYPLGIDNEFIQKKSRITVHQGCVCIIQHKEFNYE